MKKKVCWITCWAMSNKKGGVQLSENKEIIEKNAYPDYYEEFASTSIRSYNLFDPFTRNSALKLKNSNPKILTRENTEKAVYNPNENEQNLIRLSEHFYNTQFMYKRLIEYFAGLLTLNWYPTPKLLKTSKDTSKNATQTQYLKDFNDMMDWFDKFNHKQEFESCLLKIMKQDVIFVYVRENSKHIVLQEMPTEYCKITRDSPYGYLYSFDLTYFEQSGVNINQYAREFKKYYNDYRNLKSGDNKKASKITTKIRPEMRSNGTYAYWVDIPEGKGWVFKFNNDIATILPPLMGLFLDAVDIDQYKELQMDKTKLEISMIIMGTIPLKKDVKGSAQTNDFAISATEIAHFNKAVQSLLPQNIEFRSTPLDNLKSFQFQTSPTKDNIVGNQISNYYKNAGVSQGAFGGGDPNAIESKAGQKIDVAFVVCMYRQFENFCQYYIDRITSTFKFKVNFMGNIYSEDEDKETYKSAMVSGLILPQLAAAYGMNLRELSLSKNMMEIIGLGVDSFVPIKTSSTLGNKDEDNKPQKNIEDLTESGVKTRTTGSNIEKGGEV
jgi:hypothetical protein